MGMKRFGSFPIALAHDEISITFFIGYHHSGVPDAAILLAKFDGSTEPSVRCHE
jgi:hypothetical protein